MPYEGNHPYPEEKTLAQLQDRWDRHVSICKQCQQVSDGEGCMLDALLSCNMTVACKRGAHGRAGICP